MAETVIDLRRDRAHVASGGEKQVEVYPEAVLGRLLSFVGRKRVSARDRAVAIGGLRERVMGRSSRPA